MSAESKATSVGEIAVIEFADNKDGCCRRATFTSTGEILGILLADQQRIRLGRWDVQTATLVEKSDPFDQGHFLDFVLSPDDSKIALQFFERPVIVDRQTLQRTLSIPHGGLYPKCVAWSPDGRYLAIGGRERLKCVDRQSGEVVQSIKFHGEAKAIGFTSPGEITACLDSDIRVWRVGASTIDTLTHLENPGRTWNHAVGAKWIASASDKGDLILTSTADGGQRRHTIAKNGSADLLRFSRDQSKIVIGFSNGAILVWDVVADKELLRWKKPRYTGVDSLDFNADNSLLLCLIASGLFVLDFRKGAKSRPVARPKLPEGMLRCLTFVGSDNRMDQKGYDTPLNPLPLGCPVCKLPDLDFVPQPYLLAKGVDSPAELAAAEVGNLLVRARARKVLELAAPGQCAFYPTQKKTGEATGWYLAVPLNKIVTGRVKENVPRCEHCGEPLHAHGSQYENVELSPIAPFEMFKTQNWFSVATDIRRLASGVDKRHQLSLSRQVHASLRLALLIDKLGLRGLEQCMSSRDEPSQEDHAWARKQLSVLEGQLGGDDAEANRQWFEDYLATKRRKPKPFDFSEIEQDHNLTLPDAYKKFVEKIGSKIFRNIDGEEGFDVRVLLPNELDFDALAGRIKDDPEADAGADGIVFAETGFGDVFCFKRVPATNEFEVYRYDHEMDDLELYAKNFESTIRAWAGK
jgi:WD40 repeat protein